MKALVVAVLLAAAVLTNAQTAAAAPASFSSTVAAATTCIGVPGGAPTAALALTTSACTGSCAQIWPAVTAAPHCWPTSSSAPIAAGCWTS